MIKLIVAAVLLVLCLACNGYLRSLRKKQQEYEQRNTDEPDYDDRWSLDREELNAMRGARVLRVVFGVLTVGMVAWSLIATVPSGYTGVITTFGRVEETPAQSGLNFVAPWQQVTRMDNRVQVIETEMQAFTSDTQEATIKMAVNYSLSPTMAAEVYKSVGVNYRDIILVPRIPEITKNVTGKFEAEPLIKDRDILSPRIKELLTEEMAPKGIINIEVSILDIDFSDVYTAAVERKQVATQDRLTAETEQARMTMEKEAEAQRAIIEANAKAEQDVIAANADLEVVKIQADAALYAGEKEAAMNERIAASMSELLVRYNTVKQWNGQLPTMMLGDSNGLMFDLPDPVSGN